MSANLGTSNRPQIYRFGALHNVDRWIADGACPQMLIASLVHRVQHLHNNLIGNLGQAEEALASCAIGGVIKFSHGSIC